MTSRDTHPGAGSGGEAPASRSYPAEAAVAEVERAMIEIRRSMSRRTVGKRVMKQLGEPLDFSALSVVDAVSQGPNEEHPEVTVGVIASRLGIDPSRASRVVSSAIKQGYVQRVASQADGRRISLELTERGWETAGAAHTARIAFFRELMDGWAVSDRTEFARLLTKFVAALRASDGG